MSKLYIAVLDICPDYMVPTLVAHAVLGNHLSIVKDPTTSLCVSYHHYLKTSFKKVVLKVNQKQFNKIATLPNAFPAHENTIDNGNTTCLVYLYDDLDGDIPNVLKFASMWKPKENTSVNTGEVDSCAPSM